MLTYIVIITVIAVISYCVIKNNTKPKTNVTVPQVAEETNTAVQQVEEEETNHQTATDTPLDNYWEVFKRNNPIRAAEIQILVEKDLDTINDDEATEIVNNILRLSDHTGIPVSDLKDIYHSQASED